MIPDRAQHDTDVSDTLQPIWSGLREALSRQLPVSRYGGMRLLLAVSGGADSVALLRLVVDVWGRDPRARVDDLVVAHFNHAVRGAASDDDEQWVTQLSKSLGLCCHTGRHQVDDTDSTTRTDEQSLRRMRHRFLRSCAYRVGARCVLMAHQADDNVETVLHRLFRGTGPAGLTGIAPHRSMGEDLVLLRPLLEIRGQSLRDGLQEIGQPWREDGSNRDCDYQRNWLRHAMLPQIRQRYPGADRAILRMIRFQGQWREPLERVASAWIEQSVSIEGQCLRIDRGPVDSAILAIAIHRLWDAQNWPRVSLTASQLALLHEAVSGPPIVRLSLPGGVDVQATNGDQITIIGPDRGDLLA